MTAPRIHTSGQNNWHRPQPMHASERLYRHGKVQSMDEPRPLWRRLLGRG